MGNAPLAPIEIDDIAQIAFAILHSGGQDGKRSEMTGPQALTMTDISDHLSDVLGKKVRYVNITADEKKQALLAAGIPPAFADALGQLFNARRTGHSKESHVNLDAHRTFGIRPTTFADFALKNAPIFRGEAAPAQLWAPGWQSTVSSDQPK